MAKPKVDTKPIAAHYARKGQRIVEYTSDVGGGLIAFEVIDGRLIVDLYRHDDAVDIRVKSIPPVPDNFPVKVLGPGDPATDRVTCGECKRSWDDAVPTSYTPSPGARCPFEYYH